jgi:hypothetical protein
VPELTQAARDLYAIGEKIHKDLQRRFMLPVWIALAVGAVLVLAGWLYVNNRIEANSRGLRVTVATQQKIIDNQQAQIVADCPQNKQYRSSLIQAEPLATSPHRAHFSRRGFREYGSSPIPRIVPRRSMCSPSPLPLSRSST